MVFDHSGAEVARHQLEHAQIMPRPGWVEHDPAEIWERTRAVVEQGLHTAGLRTADLVALGLTNQRETTLAWNRRTGRPYANAIVWQDTRTDRIAAGLDRDGRGEVIRHKAGLPPATYFSGAKLQWMLDHVDGQHAATVGQVCLDPGEAKNTYGTGNFLLLNTGTEIVRSGAGLLTTVCYKFGAEPAVYALEGSSA